MFSTGSRKLVSVAVVGVVTVATTLGTERLRAAYCSAASDLQPAVATSRTDMLRSWRSGTVTDRLERNDFAAITPSRRVIAVVGITGSGKSSVCNTLAGRTHRPFALSSSLVSVTTAVSHRDYTFFGEWRVIDTPGLLDTNKGRDENEGEVLRLAALAPHGLAAILVVIPRGRFTAEQESALSRLDDLFGPSLRRHAILVITGALDGDAPAGAGAGGTVGPGASTVSGIGLLSRDALLAEISALPLGHYLRTFVESIAYRVVPVENRLDPFKQVSRMSLHQRVVDMLSENGGSMYDVKEFVLRAGAHAAARWERENMTGSEWDASEAAPFRGGVSSEPITSGFDRVLSVPKGIKDIGPCRYSVRESTRSMHDSPRAVLTIECDLNS